MPRLFAVPLLVSAVLFSVLTPVGVAAAADSPSAAPTATAGASAPTAVAPTTPTAAPSSTGSGKPATAPSRQTARSAAITGPCGGALAFGEIRNCAGISGSQVQTYTVTTTVAHDRLLFTYHQDPTASASINVSLTDGTGQPAPCQYTGSTPQVCPAETVGTYTLTLSPSWGQAAYSVSFDSALAGKCTDYPAAQFAFGSTGLSGNQADGSTGDCYRFTQPTGALLTLSAPVTPAWGSQSPLTLTDSTGASVCQYLTSCRLTGTAPYTVRVASPQSTAFAYTLLMRRLDAPVGCRQLPLAPFGDPGSAAADGSVQLGDQTCFSISAPAGLLGVRLINKGGAGGAYPSWAILDGTGAQACSSSPCKLATAGSYNLLVQPGSYGGYDFRVAAVALSANTGCAGSVGTGFDLPAVQGNLVSSVEVDCQPFDAQPGDRIIGAVGDSWITDATGADICVRDFTQDGCVLPGSGPYRMLTANNYGTTGAYQLQIRRLNNPVGCPSALPQPYGTPTDTSPASCRTLQVTSGGHYVISSANSSTLMLYKRDGTRLCADVSPCDLPSAGSFTLLNSGGSLTFHSPTETGGCVAGDDNAIVNGPTVGTLPSAGVQNCYLLPSPQGSRVGLIAPPKRAGLIDAGITVLDATGLQQCAVSAGTQFCDLKGTAPFRMLVGGTTTGTYSINVVRLGQDRGCTSFAASGFATVPAPGAKASLAADRTAACFSLPAGSHSSAEMLDFGYSALGAVPPQILAGELYVNDSTGAEVCRTFAYASTQAMCQLDPAKSYTVLLAADGSTNDFQLVRRDISAGADCSAAADTTVGGAQTRTVLSSGLDARCIRINAATADQLIISTATDNGATSVLVTDSNGKSVCATGRYQARCTVNGSIDYQVIVTPTAFSGTPITSRLDIWRIVTDNGFAAECPAVASSAKGFGPFTGTLTADHPVACAVVPVKASDSFTVTGVGDSSNLKSPQVSMLSRNLFTQGYLGNDYCGTNYGATQASCNVSYNSPDRQALLLLTLRPGGDNVPYNVSATCSGTCGGATVSMDSVSPAAGTTGTTATITVKGTGFTPQSYLSLNTNSGQKQATVKNVSADGTTLTATLDLTGMATGTGRLTLGSSTVLNQSFTVVAALPPGGGRYTAATPARLLDTRDGIGRSGGTPVTPGGVVSLAVAGQENIPQGIKSVVLNVTVTSAASGGHLSAWASGSPQPNASSLNWFAGQEIANQVVVPVGPDGRVNLLNGGWDTTHVVVDVFGYFSDNAAGTMYTPVAPARMLDTRQGIGRPGNDKVPAGGTVSLQVAGVDGVPQGVKAVVLNMTVTKTESSGHLTTWASGSAQPNTSNLNWAAGDEIANLVVVPVGPDGKINVLNGGWAPTHVVADVFGYYSDSAAGSTFTAVDPARMLDTRQGIGRPGNDKVPAGGTVSLQVAGVNGVPQGVKAVVLNVTVTSADGGGHLSAWASGSPQPDASNLNWTTGEEIANLVVVPVGPDGKIVLLNGGWAPTHLVADVFGYYS